MKSTGAMQDGPCALASSFIFLVKDFGPNLRYKWVGSSHRRLKNFERVGMAKWFRHRTLSPICTGFESPAGTFLICTDGFLSCSINRHFPFACAGVRFCDNRIYIICPHYLGFYHKRKKESSSFWMASNEVSSELWSPFDQRWGSLCSVFTLRNIY